MLADSTLTEKRWAVKESGDVLVIAALSKSLNISPTLAGLLVKKGITTFEEAKKFFRPDIKDLHDPFLMKDMDKAIARIDTAISSGEKILIYGDYDVDGTTAVALVYSYLRTIYDKLDFYLPDRYKEGYGVSTAGIDYAKSNNISLIIALDCGIKAIDKVEYAKTLGIDFIICDHHRPGEILPDAFAVLDPKRVDCSYPYKELSGCGIGFKLVQAYLQKHDLPFSQLEKYLDLVAVSTAADIVPITGENRVLVYYGLKRLNENPRHGLEAILKTNNIQKKEFVDTSSGEITQRYNMDVANLVFVIGPRINAAGRIYDARHAVDLLIADDHSDAWDGSVLVNKHNDERRELDLSITEHALAIVRDDPRFINRKTTVLFHPEWHKGVIGIVASRLTEKYYRPTIILTESNGMATGSARSVKDFDIYNALESCSDLLEQFGGHMYAAGLTLKLENIEKFVDRFEQVVSSTIEEKMLTQEVEIDAEIKLTDITPSFFNVLRQFSPFGPGNMNPIFKSEGVRDTGMSRIVGNNHLKLNLAQDETTRYGIDGIAFQMGQYHPFIRRKIPFDICYTLEENTFNGKTSIQLNVKDIKVK